MHNSVAAPPESDILLPFLESLENARVRSGWASLGFEEVHVAGIFSAMTNYVFSSYADSMGGAERPQLAILKEPGYARHATGLHSLFSDSKFLLLFRHPVGAVGSLTGGGDFEPDFPGYWELFPQGPATDKLEICLRAAAYWNHVTDSMLAIENSERSMVVRYESLCFETEAELRRIVKWLGLEWTGAVLNYDASKSDRGREGNKALGHRTFSKANADPLRRWGGVVSGEVESIWQTCSPLAGKLGFEPV